MQTAQAANYKARTCPLVPTCVLVMRAGHSKWRYKHRLCNRCDEYTYTGNGKCLNPYCTRNPNHKQQHKKAETPNHKQQMLALNAHPDWGTQALGDMRVRRAQTEIDSAKTLQSLKQWDMKQRCIEYAASQMNAACTPK